MSHAGLAVTARGVIHLYRAEGHDVAALSGVDLAVEPGQVIALLGPSGSGKSTLVSILAGLLVPSAGVVSIGDTALHELAPRQLDRLRATQVGIVLQGSSRNLIPALTLRANLQFAQSAARQHRGEVAKIDRLAELVGLAGQLDRPLAQLSATARQRAALATAIAAGPGLILADEPTNRLDHEARAEILATLTDINRTTSATIIVVTHDPQVAGWAPRTVTIRDGRVGAEGRLGEEFAVVSLDGSLPLPAEALRTFPPGSLVRVSASDGTWTLQPAPLDPGPDQRSAGW